jgi:outer membrane protein
MKRLVAVGLALICGGFALPSARAQEVGSRIVAVNLERLFNEYYKTKRADAQLRSQAEEFNKERQAFIAAAEAAQKEFTTLRDEAQNPVLTEEARTSKRALAEEKLLAIREQETQIKRFEELRSKQLEEQSRRMRRGLVEEIREAVRAYAKAKAYDLVLDLSGNSMNGVELVLYSSVSLDITGAVLTQINEGVAETEKAEAAPEKEPGK